MGECGWMGVFFISGWGKWRYILYKWEWVYIFYQCEELGGGKWTFFIDVWGVGGGVFWMGRGE